jgi:hypothetical protein
MVQRSAGQLDGMYGGLAREELGAVVAQELGGGLRLGDVGIEGSPEARAGADQ